MDLLIYTLQQCLHLSKDSDLRIPSSDTQSEWGGGCAVISKIQMEK